MDSMTASVISDVISGVTLAALLGVAAVVRGIAREQRESIKATREFERSMQRAEINRYFRIVVEQGLPVSPEELTHLESCYEAYHAHGGNGTGTLMYERIREHARIETGYARKEGS